MPRTVTVAALDPYEGGETLYFCSKGCRNEYLSASGGRWRAVAGIGRAIRDRLPDANNRSVPPGERHDGTD
jgi:hypothetical protein